MIEFLNANIYSFIAILIVLFFVFISIKLGYEKQVRQFMLYLVLKAEKEFGGKTGKLKFSAVASWVYEKLPSVARIFVSANDIEELIEDGVELMKKYLAENKNVTEIIIQENK